MSVALDPVRIESIEIIQAPGIPNGLKLDAFGPGINVVTGPNASGKSTTARLLHQLFSNTAAREDIEATIRFRYGDSAWTVRRYGQHITVYKDGVLASLPQFEEMSDDTRSRYLLSLHDLLRADDMAFARVVVQEAGGGFDLERAASSIQYELPKTESSLTREWDSARKAVDAARRKQELLAQEESRLQSLRREEHEAIAAQARLGLLNEIEAALDAKEALDEASARFAEFPQELDRYHGDEPARIESLNERQQKLLENQRFHQALIEREQAALQAAGIVPGQETREIIERLQGLVTTLDRQQIDVERSAASAKGASERERSQREGISSVLQRTEPDESARQLLLQLAEIVDRREEAAARLGALQQLQDWVGEIPEQRDLGTVQEASRLLRQWLQTPELVLPDPAIARLRLLALAAAVMLIIEGILLGVAVHPALSALALVGFGVGVAAYLLRPAPTTDERRLIALRITQMALPAPESWDEPAVIATVNALNAEEQQELYARAVAARWSGLADEAERTRANVDEFEAAAIHSYRELGIEGEISRLALDQIAQSIQVWRTAVDTMTEANAQLGVVTDARNATLISFNELVARFGFDDSIDVHQAHARLNELQRRAQEASRAADAVSGAQHEISAIVTPGLEEIEREFALLLQSVSASDVETVLRLASERTHWLEHKRMRDECQATFRDRTRNLTEIDLAEWSHERVMQERAELERIASGQQEISRRIGAIVSGVNEARLGTTIDSALRAEERVAMALRERFRLRARQMIADRIVEHVRRESEISSLSPVAGIARQRFAEFTRGRYLLHFRVVDGKPVFLAEDRHAGGRELQLDQLSSATRVQLLIAVRAAFVEANERQVALPLFLDETLANSDDIRADAMVAATNDLSAGGRQIFYFTAQQDEVARWQAWHAEHPEVPLTIAVLGAAETTRRIETPVVFAHDMRPLPHHPNGCSRSEYRRSLGVPHLDRWSDNEGDIHLWFLEPDLDRLWSLLNKRIETWGQLRTFVDAKLESVLGLTGSNVSAIRARAHVCQIMREQSRIGRGRPVTPLDLDATGAFSERFRNDAVVLLEQCERNGGVFLQRLKLGALKGFYGTKTQAVEDYFQSNGHLAFEAELEVSELQHRVILSSSTVIESGVIGLPDINRLFEDLAEISAVEPLAMQDNGSETLVSA